MYNAISKLFILAGIFLLPAVPVCTAQQAEEDPVLFTIGDDEIRVSEFNYIYNKNNANNADYSRASLEEYLDLYIKFKLKVRRARDLQMDTISSLQKELAGYRKQLSDSYLLDKEVKNRLIREAYEREAWDLHASHILFKWYGPKSMRDTSGYYRRTMKVREQIESPEDFARMALEHSEDATVRENKGDLGYVTAILPSGFYQLENALYSMEPGEISMPVQSKRGYHILMLHDKRPARGEMEIAHILVRKGGSAASHRAAKARIEEIYKQLEQGASFEEAARQNSDDKASGAKGGYIGFISIGTYEAAFEDAAFALSADGEYSNPVETKVGYHIIKRISKVERGTLAQEKRRIENELVRTERIELAKDELIRRIKSEAGFREFKSGYNKFVSTLDSTFYDFNWRISRETPGDALFTIGDRSYTGTDFGLYLTKNRRQRLQLARSTNIIQAANTLYEQFVDESVLQFEESRLEEKYPDFKALMREYEEGILLFELTNRKVWSKASRDTVGLEEFYRKHRNDYQWNERALVQYFTIDSTDRATLEKIHKVASKKPVSKVLKKFNKDGKLVSVIEKKFERDNRNMADIAWEKGYITDLPAEAKGGKYFFTKVARILPPEPKGLNEARGYVIADYQDFLEKQWVVDLREQYEVDLREDVFESLVKK